MIRFNLLLIVGLMLGACQAGQSISESKTAAESGPDFSAQARSKKLNKTKYVLIDPSAGERAREAKSSLNR